MLSQVTWERRLFFALSNYYLTPIKKNQTKSKSFKNEEFSVIIKHCVKGLKKKSRLLFLTGVL